MTAPTLNPCKCKNPDPEKLDDPVPAQVVEDADPSIEAYLIKCSLDCEGQYLTAWHPTLEAAADAWNNGRWGL